MKRTKGVWRGLLLVAGLVLLLLNAGVFGPADQIVGPLVFGVGGVLFLGLFVTNRTQWWAAMPGGALLGFATVSALDQWAPRRGQLWGGTLFFGSISLGFWLIAFTQRRHWWTMIPGGALLTLAVIAGLDRMQPGVDHGSVLFFGLALTFGLVALRSPGGAPMLWALLPAGVLAAIGMAILTSTAAWLNYVGAAAMILVGIYLILRTRRTQPKEPRPITPAEHGDESRLPQPH